MTLVAAFLLLTACEKENVDVLQTTTTTPTPEVIYVGTPPNECEAGFNLQSDAVNLGTEGVAYLVQTPCAGTLEEYDYYYLVTLAPDFDISVLGPLIRLPEEGIPGFGFGGDGTAQPGDELSIYGFSQFRPWITNDWYNSQNLRLTFTGDVVVTLNAAGTEVGESVGGTITGTLVDPFGPQGDILYPFTGTFCVPIVTVCQ